MLACLACAIDQATERVVVGQLLQEELPTAAFLARELGFKLDKVKKKLKFLNQAGLIQSVSMSPKRYQFDRYALSRLAKDHPWYDVFYDHGSPYCMFQ